MLGTSDLAPAWVLAVAGLLGALWGSFFNVAIYRWPRDLSVVTPASHCPACGAPVPFFRNIPIVGFLLLRGRAACCGARLSARYVVVETLSALLCMAVAHVFIVQAPAGTFLSEGILDAALYFAFVGGLIVATFVDLEWMEIPDEVSLPGAALGLLTVTWRSGPTATESAIGAGLGFLLVQVLFVWMYERVRGRRGMGEGDAKLLLMVGAFLGWRGVLFSLVGGALQGLLAVGVAFVTGHPLTPAPSEGSREHEAHPESQPPGGELARRDSASERDLHAPGPEPESAPGESEPAKIPFGPFLALGALEYLFFSDTIAEWLWYLV